MTESVATHLLANQLCFHRLRDVSLTRGVQIICNSFNFLCQSLLCFLQVFWAVTALYVALCFCLCMIMEGITRNTQPPFLVQS